MKRRAFLVIPVAALSSSVLNAIGRRVPLRVEHGQVRVPLKFFTAQEAKVVAAMCERIFPRDASGPGATDAGVVVYIDRQLAGPYGRDKYRYTRGPFTESVPEHGYQGKALPREIYRDGIRELGDISVLSVEEQDAILRTIDRTPFFALARQHTIEGMFSDPMHGGNANMVGWRLIGYPGPQLNYRDHIDQHYGRAYRPKPVSLREATHVQVRPWEEES